jgi:hypothetical protein
MIDVEKMCSNGVKDKYEADVDCGGLCEYELGKECLCTDEKGGQYCEWLTNQSSSLWYLETIQATGGDFIPVARDYEGNVIAISRGGEYILENFYPSDTYPNSRLYTCFNCPYIITFIVDKSCKLTLWRYYGDEGNIDEYQWNFDNPENPIGSGLNMQYTGNASGSGCVITLDGLVCSENPGFNGGIIKEFTSDKLILYCKPTITGLLMSALSPDWYQLNFHFEKPKPKDSLDCWYFTFYKQ